MYFRDKRKDGQTNGQTGKICNAAYLNDRMIIA